MTATAGGSAEPAGGTDLAGSTPAVPGSPVVARPGADWSAPSAPVRLARGRPTRTERPLAHRGLWSLPGKGRGRRSASPSRPPCSGRATTRSAPTSAGARPTATSRSTTALILMHQGGRLEQPVTRRPWCRTGRACGRYAVQAWSDPLATWRHAVEAKAAAGQSGGRAGERPGDRRPAAGTGADPTGAALRRRDQGGDRGAAGRPPGRSPNASARRCPTELWPVLTADPIRELITTSEPGRRLGGPPLAEFGSWYEFFPRSCGAEVDDDGRPLRHGTFADARRPARPRGGDGLRHRLPAADPPDRRGEPQGPQQLRRTAEPGDVGSPWAIGSAAGGHDAVHPELGTHRRLRRLRGGGPGRAASRWRSTWRCKCAPDHPWVTEHPEWFTTRPDGSIAYAENPPKKYQDIYPLNFDNDPDRAVRRGAAGGAVLDRPRGDDLPGGQPAHQADQLLGVADRRRCTRRNPEVIFLAEAFTAPAMMHELARLGFTPVLHLLHLAHRQGRD